MKVFIDTNVFLDYIEKRPLGAKEAIAIFMLAAKEEIELFTIVPIGATGVDRAISIEARDFEDALQYFSAEQAGADCIVTRNTKDFDFAVIETLEPKDFLDKYFNIV